MKNCIQFKKFNFFATFILFIIVFIGCSQNQDDVIKSKEEIQMEKILDELEGLKSSNQEFINTNKKLRSQISNLENAFDKNETNLQEKIFQLYNIINDLKEKLDTVSESSTESMTAADKAELKQKMNEETFAIMTTPQPSSNITILDAPRSSNLTELLNPENTTIPNETQEEKSAESENNAATDKDVDIIEKDINKKNEDFSDPNLSEPEFPFILKQQVNARKEYIEAYRFYTLKDYNEAIKKFHSFLQKYPDEYYADNSQYWIAMSYLKLNKLDLAQENFHNLLKKFEHGETSLGFKTPDAILGLGQIKLKQKQNEHAIYYFNKIIEKYPNSSAARTALNLLNNIEN